MKYANLVYKWRNDEINMGDDIQILAIDYLYTLMGIPPEKIIKISFYELCEYDGEEVILPICFPFHSYVKEDYFTLFSPKIKPIFLNLSISGMKISSKDSQYLKRYEPIGCRDLNTLRTLQKEGIDAYANGCITQIFPDRGNKLYSDKVFLVDVDKTLLESIPNELKQKAEMRTHSLRYSEIKKASREIAIDQLNEYAENAGLVVTSRLHCALPCIAMGIPTVFAAPKRSHRFEGVDRIVKFYCSEEYEHIDWIPQSIDYETIKNKIIDMNIRRIRGEEIDKTELRSINQIFNAESVCKYNVDYISETLDFIDNLIEKENGKINYYLWGITPIAFTLFWYIRSKWEKSNLLGVVDKNKKIEFCGTVSGSKDEIIKEKAAWIFVTTRNALYESEAFFADNGINNHYQCCGNKYNY